eukprot:TRINITY_DN40616_c0_g1_i1.p1 TRINITY_DN40616_c0_g1~~TRINITY_DN40616_c0_g1_i1.p1  ORF type:complete len:110 (+),score=19.19 TRINITY_DN40616_c0_g1_i1:71-400(+)
MSSFQRFVAVVACLMVVFVPARATQLDVSRTGQGVPTLSDDNDGWASEYGSSNSNLDAVLSKEISEIKSSSSKSAPLAMQKHGNFRQAKHGQKHRFDYHHRRQPYYHHH